MFKDSLGATIANVLFFLCSAVFVFFVLHLATKSQQAKSPRRKKSVRKKASTGGKLKAKAMEGVVKWFDEKKYYGFVESDQGDVFIHGSSVKGKKLPRESSKVVFDLMEVENKKEGRNVSILKY